MVVFPLTGGYPLGFLQYLGIPTVVQFVMVIHIVALSMLFTSILFFYHHQILSPMPRWLGYRGAVEVILAATVVLFILHCIIIVYLDPMKDKKYFLAVSFKEASMYRLFTFKFYRNSPQSATKYLVFGMIQSL